MLETIAQVCCAGSFIGIMVILYRKNPLLISLPARKEMIAAQIGDRIKDLPFLKSIFSGVLLQRVLSKIRILTLKIENKISLWLTALRLRSLKQKVYQNDNYWQDLKSQPQPEKRIRRIRIKKEESRQEKVSRKKEDKRTVKKEEKQEDLPV
ncbi:MAG: hypothetical protein ABIF89_01555 [bacterium]